MKDRKTLKLNRESLADLRTDEMSRVGGGNTGVACYIDGPTPKCPVYVSVNTECESFPVLECLVSGIACL